MKKKVSRDIGLIIALCLFCIPSAYGANKDDIYNNALRDGVVYAQTQKWDVAAQYWQAKAEKLSKDSAFDQVDITFLEILRAIALERSGNAKAYSVWANALGRYLENGTSWLRERQALSAVIEKVKYDVGSSFSSEGVSISGETKSALILESLDNILNFTTYDGPQPGLKKAPEAELSNVSVSRSYFARPSAYVASIAEPDESRSRTTVDVDSDNDEIRNKTLTRGLQLPEKHTELVSPPLLVEDLFSDVIILDEADKATAHPTTTVSEVVLTQLPEIQREQTAPSEHADGKIVSEGEQIEKIKSEGELVKSKQIFRRALTGSTTELTATELEYAKRAWRYFENNHQPNTGLYNSVHKYTFTTIWDVGSSLAALFCAYEIGVIDELYYDEKMASILNTLQDIPLYKGVLPNREYDTRTGLMVNLKNIVDDSGSGYSSLDIGRTLTWLAIIDRHHDRFSEKIDAIVVRWNLERVLNDGEFHRDLLIDGKVDRKQEGRIGYEQYAALAFLQWDIEAENAMDVDDAITDIVSGVEILRDSRTPDFLNLEPFLITMLEYSPVPRVIPQQASSLINAHIMQSNKTGTSLLHAEDSIDEAPWFLYNTISSPEGDWLCKTGNNIVVEKCQAVSIKAAFMANMLFGLDYIENILTEVRGHFDLRNGYYAGVYNDGTVNKALTSNTNALILESLAFKKRGGAFLDGAYEERVAASKSRLAN